MSENRAPGDLEGDDKVPQPLVDPSTGDELLPDDSSGFRLKITSYYMHVYIHCAISVSYIELLINSSLFQLYKCAK